jgi:hypothetical protein
MTVMTEHHREYLRALLYSEHGDDGDRCFEILQLVAALTEKRYGIYDTETHVAVSRKMMEELETWSVGQYGLEYTELWNRREQALLHPEMLIPLEEVMRWLTPDTPQESRNA